LTSSRSSRLFLRKSEDGVVARLVDAHMEGVGVEKLALLLSGIGEIASNKSGSK